MVDNGNTTITEFEQFDSDEVKSIAVKTVSMLSQEKDNSNKNEQLKLVHEGDSTKIYCLNDPENKFSSCTGAVAVKMLHDDFPGDDEVSCLQNEYTISNHLSQCSAVRAAFTQTDLDGVPAIFLEWAPGITLDEWIGSIHKKGRPYSLDCNDHSEIVSERDMKIALQLALNISKALADIHSAGVIHNNLALGNIIVDNNNDGDNLYVKVIGLGSAYLQTDTNRNASDKQKELKSLGSIFFEMFTGQCPFQKNHYGDSDSGKENTENKVFLSQNQLVSILTARVPIAIAKFTLKLMEVERTKPYFQSAQDVNTELAMILFSLDSMMSMPATRTSLGRLLIPKDKLYGRDSHLSKLMEVCSRIGTSGRSEMVLISGYSGAGKSAMVEHVKANLRETNIRFISGKFDQLQHMEPLSAIDAALTDYSNYVIQQDIQTINETRGAIASAIDTDIGVLTEAFPCLCKIIGTPTAAPTEVDSMAAQNRFKFIFRMFIRAIAIPSHPIVLFLDDLQWADALSLELVSDLVSDTEIGGLLFIGSCRNNEVDSAHPLTAQVNELKSKKVVITNINIAGISREDVNVMISDTICMPQPLTKSLANIVYKKTSGNAFFVTQFLQSLWVEGLLLFSFELNTWQWDAEAIDAKDIADDVGMLMSRKILELPAGCQHAMKLLACVGSKCDESIIRLLMGNERGLQTEANFKEMHSDISEWGHEFLMLDFAVGDGLLKKEGSTYMFTHDQIQQAAYSLIPEIERGHLHKQIGYLILEHVPVAEVDIVLFTAVDQLNRGKMFIEEEDKRMELARLNLRAGEKAMSLATFLSSISYLKAGIGMLCDGHWKKYYGISLQLYSSYAEAEFCLGHFQEVGHVTGIVIREAKSFEDKTPVYATLIKALSAQNKMNDAFGICFNILSQLGVDLDKPISIEDMVTTKKSFEDLTDDEFLKHKEMDDSNMIKAMKFLNHLLFCAYLGKQAYFRLITNQMLKLTRKYGVIEESITALAGLSLLLVAVKDFKGADRIGHFALILLERLKAYEYLPQVYASVHGGILTWTNHTKLCLEPLMHAYRVGMQTGNLIFAMMNAHRYSLHSFVAGRNLLELARDIEVLGKQMVEYKQSAVYEMLFPIKEVTTILISSIDNPLLPFRQTTENKDMLAQSLKENNYYKVAQWYTFGSIVAYIYGDYDLAADMVQKRQEVEKMMPKPILLSGMRDLYDGLIFLAMAHKSDDFQWNLLGSDATLKIESYVKLNKLNFEHKLLLLQAEIASITGEKEDALMKYDLAITLAEKNEFIHEQAIASERAADFLLRNSDSRASHYYGKAQSLYLQWGAQGKADHLCKNIPF